ncbi:winged helix-turn-helix transcriptional regulator [Thiolapillus sp.]
MTKQKETARLFKRSPCPVACTLDILGDKWTLLVVRDLFAGKKTYSEFQNSPESIPTNILADRLKRLAGNGIVEKKPYQKHPVRYEYVLTDKGRDLGAVLQAMVQWGERHIPGSKAQMRPVVD